VTNGENLMQIFLLEHLGSLKSEVQKRCRFDKFSGFSRKSSLEE
jgi:hypothetical protein